MSTTTKARHTSKIQTPASRPYEPWLRERLAADPQEATQYLEVAIEDEDPRVFLLALKDVTEAYGGIGRLAKATGLNRENLYRMLSKEGNPELVSLARVLHALGLRLKVEPFKRTKFSRGKLLRSVVPAGSSAKSLILSGAGRTGKARRTAGR